MEHPETQDPQEMMAPQEKRQLHAHPKIPAASNALLDRPDLLDRTDLQDRPAQMDSQGIQAREAVKVLQARPVLRETADPPETQDHPGNLVNQAKMALAPSRLLDPRDPADLQDHRALQDPMETLAAQDLWDPQAPQVPMVNQETQDRTVNPDSLEAQAFQDRMRPIVLAHRVPRSLCTVNSWAPDLEFPTEILLILLFSVKEKMKKDFVKMRLLE